MRTVSRVSTSTSGRAPTCARSPTRSAATAGRCGALEVGPFSVDDADEERILAAARGAAVPARGRRDRRRGGGDPRRAAAGTAGRSHAPGRRARRRRAGGDGREGRPLGRRAGAGRIVRSRSARSTASTSATAGSSRRPSQPGRCRRSSRSIRIRGGCWATASSCLTTLERRLELLAELGVEETLVVEFSLEFQRIEPEDVRARRPRGDRRAGGRGRRRLPLRSPPRRRSRRCWRRSASTSGRCRWSRGSRRRRSASCSTPGEVDAAAGLLGRPAEVEGLVVEGDARGGTLGFPTANLAAEADLLVPGERHLRGLRRRAPRGGLDRDEPALRRRRAADRGLPARLRGRSLRPAAGRRALAAAPRRARVRERAGADRPDRARRRGDRAGRAAELSLVTQCYKGAKVARTPRNSL